MRLVKHDVLAATSSIDLGLLSPVERVLQTYAIPLGAFQAADPAFDTTALDGFRLRFDRRAAGSAWIADVTLGR